MNLRSKVIRLAYQNPEFREQLLPLVAKEARLDSATLRQFRRGSYFHRFFSEKEIPYKVFTKRAPDGTEHSIPNTVVIEHIAQTSGAEAKKIERVLTQIDFHNGDVNHFLEHLAGAIAANY